MAIPNRIRLRREEFQVFSTSFEAVFRKVANRDPKHKTLEEIYSFHTSPGGRFGGHDARTVEAFYGQRPFESIKEINWREFGIPRITDRLLIEKGATISYQRGNNGTVLCTIHPAGSDGFRRREEGILLALIRDPGRLNSSLTLERHWKAFMSYMQCTSLEGEPTIVDRIRLHWLLFTRIQIVEGKTQTPHVWDAMLKVFSFSLTVGLSGFLLATVQWWFTGMPGR